MIRGLLMILSPWKANSSTRVSRSASTLIAFNFGRKSFWNQCLPFLYLIILRTPCWKNQRGSWWLYYFGESWCSNLDVRDERNRVDTHTFTYRTPLRFYDLLPLKVELKLLLSWSLPGSCLVSKKINYFDSLSRIVNPVHNLIILKDWYLKSPFLCFKFNLPDLGLFIYPDLRIDYSIYELFCNSFPCFYTIIAINIIKFIFC